MAFSKKFKLYVLDRVTDELDDAVNYYNSKQNGLGKRFYLEYKKTLKTIKLNPYYRVYYDDIHCLQVGKFPYLIHYFVDKQNKNITVHALICAYRSPDDAYVKR